MSFPQEKLYQAASEGFVEDKHNVVLVEKERSHTCWRAHNIRLRGDIQRLNVSNGQRPLKEQGTSPATKVGFLTNRWFDPRRLGFQSMNI